MTQTEFSTYANASIRGDCYDYEYYLFATMYPIVFIMLFLFSTQNKYENGRLFAVNMKKNG